MKRSTANSHLRQLRKRVAELTESIESLDKDVQEPLFRSMRLVGDKEPTEFGPQFSVSWGGRGTILSIDDEEITREQAMKIAVSSFWLIFESTRNAGDPGDKETFEKHMAEFTEQVKKRCWQK